MRPMNDDDDDDDGDEDNKLVVDVVVIVAAMVDVDITASIGFEKNGALRRC